MTSTSAAIADPPMDQDTNSNFANLVRSDSYEIAPFVYGAIRRKLAEDKSAEAIENGRQIDGDVNVISLPKFRKLEGRPQEKLAALQEWEGQVTAINIDDGSFYAELVDLTSGNGGQREIAEIPLDEIDPRDRANIAEGVIFRWVIGYLRKPSGQMRVSQFYIRRFPKMKARAGVQLPIFELKFEEDDVAK